MGKFILKISSLTKLILDKVGRIAVQLESQREQMTCGRFRPVAALRKEQGMWVYHGAPSSASIPDLIDSLREERLREFLK